MEQTINCMGMACPLPVVNAKKAMEAFTEDGVLTIKVDNETAVQNLSRLADHKGFKVSSSKLAEKEFLVRIDVKAGAKAGPEETIMSCTTVAGQGTVVVLSADTMGTGDPVLGKKLMNAFIFALKNQDFLPDKVICYNTGAYLTTENSKAIEDLKDLAAAGVTVMTCGTCLDFYGLKEKLQVGIVSNMYDIVEAQISAAKVIRP